MNTNGTKELNQPEFIGHFLIVIIDDFPLTKNQAKRRKSRIIPNILHFLDHIDKLRIEGNFFANFETLKNFPEIASLVSSRGHEIGLCLNSSLDLDRGLLQTARREIFNITGREKSGCRVIANQKQGYGYLKLLAEAGFMYVVTEFNPNPSKTDYSVRKIDFNRHGSIYSVPPSAYDFFGVKIMFGKSGRTRLYPYWFLRNCYKQFALKEIPAILNFPLWEFDTKLPREPLNPLQSLKSYGNRSIGEFKLTRLLLEFDFVRISRYLSS